MKIYVCNLNFGADVFGKNPKNSYQSQIVNLDGLKSIKLYLYFDNFIIAKQTNKSLVIINKSHLGIQSILHVTHSLQDNFYLRKPIEFLLQDFIQKL